MLIYQPSSVDLLRHRAEQDGYKALAVSNWGRAEDCFEKVGDQPGVALRIAKVCAERNALDLAKTMALTGFVKGIYSKDLESRKNCFHICILHYCLFCFGMGWELVAQAPDWEKLDFEVTWATSNDHSMTYTRLFAEFSKLIKCFKKAMNNNDGSIDVESILPHCNLLRVAFHRPMAYRDVSTAVNGLGHAAKELQWTATLKGSRAALSVAEKMQVAAAKLAQEHRSFVSKYMMKE